MRIDQFAEEQPEAAPEGNLAGAYAALITGYARAQSQPQESEVGNA